MEKFIRNNWFVAFIAIFIVMLIVLSGLGIFLNNGILGFFWGGSDDKRLDIMSSVILASVSFASALVAIILARIALLFAENEEKREFKVRLEERNKTLEETNNKIINSAKELRFVLYEFFSVLTEEIFANNRMVTEEMNTKFKQEFNKCKVPLRKFADAIKLLDSNTLIFKQYKFRLKDIENEYKNNEYKYKPYNVIDISIEMENKFIDNLNLIELWNYISKHSKSLTEKIDNFIIENKEVERLEFFKWIIFSLIIGFSLEKKESINQSEIQSILFINILLHLPNDESLKEFSEKLESEFYENHKEYATKTIDLLSGKLIQERIPELTHVKTFLENNSEFIVTNFSNTLDDFLKLSKGIAIKNKQNKINLNVVFSAMSYLDLSPYGKSVFIKMMRDDFYKILPSSGGQKYIDLADNNEDIPLDGDMQKFIDELKKHLGDKEFFTIR